MKNEPFAVFCNRVAAPGKTRIENKEHVLPEEYGTMAYSLLTKLKQAKPTFATHKITFIQNRFRDMNEIVETIKEKTVNNEIPDSVIAYFAYNLYSNFDENGEPIPGETIAYNDLPESFQNIIKVVSCYFMLLL